MQKGTQAQVLLAEKRRKALQDRRLAREKAIEENLARWEAEIVPDWKVVYKNPALRRLWWQGIPTKLRATMWEKAVGNPLALNKGTSTCQLLYLTNNLTSAARPLPGMSISGEAGIKRRHFPSRLDGATGAGC